MDVQPTVSEMKKQLATTYQSELVQIAAVFRTVEAKEQITPDLTHAAKVATKNEYVRFSPRAQRYMFTEKGAKFFRSMKKHGHA